METGKGQAVKSHGHSKHGKDQPGDWRRVSTSIIDKSRTWSLPEQGKTNELHQERAGHIALPGQGKTVYSIKAG